MGPIPGNQTEFDEISIGIPTTRWCIRSLYRICCTQVSTNTNERGPGHRIVSQICFTYWPRPFDYENDQESSQLLETTTLHYTTTPNRHNGHDDMLQFVAFKILLPIVLCLIGICFVLGIILIVKSYMMAPLKQNLAVAIRRRRRVGHAPDNNYVPTEDIRSSQRLSSSSDRKSLPPPEVLMAARERASQLLHI